MKMNEYMERTEQVVLHTYNRFPVVLKKEKAYIFMIPKERNIWISVPELRCLHLAITMRTTIRL